MSTKHFTIDIQAPKQKVWEVMLTDATYREWTDAFHPGSYFEGSWEKGSEIRFLALDEGSVGGMLSKIAENIPYEYISIEHLGEVVDGKDDVTSESALEWAGSHENYRFTEEGGVTTVDVELQGDNIDDEVTEMLEDMWPPALQKLKEIAER